MSGFIYSIHKGALKINFVLFSNFLTLRQDCPAYC